jgi:SAM-dependent methyltransferase
MSLLYPAELYERVHSCNEGAMEFYSRECADSHHVLEIGCGTGRIGSAILGKGPEVWGLDIHHESLSLAQKKGLITISGDMKDFNIDQTFDRIIIPNNTLYSMSSDQEVIRCLRTAKKHLAPDGQIIFDGYLTLVRASKLSKITVTDRQESWIKSVEFEEEEWDIFERSVLDRRRQTVKVTYRCISKLIGTEILIEVKHRYLGVSQILTLVQNSGLFVLSMQGGYLNETLSESSNNFMIRAQKVQ